MKKVVQLINLTFCLALCQSTKAVTVVASSFGWNGNDDTQSLYYALTSVTDTVIIDLQTSDWVSGPLIFGENLYPAIHNKVVLFERGVKIKALTAAFDAYLYNGLFSFVECSNIQFIGYGATIQMNKQEYINLNDGSQWRHAISLKGCDSFNVYGLELMESGGDGILLSNKYSQPIPSTNIHIKDCKINNNYRQGISITSAQNVLIEHCEITNTSGQSPELGIDIEPNNNYDVISNIVIKKCRIEGNEGGGIRLTLWMLDQTSQIVSVDVTDCYIGSNLEDGINVDVNTASDIIGTVNFERCIVENQPKRGIFADIRASLLLSFKDVVIRNVGTDNGSKDIPIYIQRPYDYWGVAMGNINFENIFIDDQLYKRNFMEINHWGQASQVENVSGTFFVYNPNGVTYNIDNPIVNVVININEITALPVADINILSNDDNAAENGTNNTLTFTTYRTSTNDISYPVGVFFDVTGTADNRMDFNYFPKAVIIPSNATDKIDTIYPVTDELNEGTEIINISVKSDSHYTTSNTAIPLYISDDTAIVNNSESSGDNTTVEVSAYIYPNPAKDILYVAGAELPFDNYKIFSNKKKVILSGSFNNGNSINVSGISKGIYLIKLFKGTNVYFVKFIKS